MPLLVVGQGVEPVNLGARSSCADVAKSAAVYFGIPYETVGVSFLREILPKESS